MRFNHCQINELEGVMDDLRARGRGHAALKWFAPCRRPERSGIMWRRMELKACPVYLSRDTAVAIPG